MKCGVCVHGGVCKHANSAVAVEEKVRNLKIEDIPEIWILDFELKCREFLPKHVAATVVNEHMKHKRQSIPEKVVSYVKALGVDNFERGIAVEYFKSVGLTQQTADTYAGYANKYVQVLKKEKEQITINGDMRKIRAEDIELKRNP